MLHTQREILSFLLQLRYILLSLRSTAKHVHIGCLHETPGSSTDAVGSRAAGVESLAGTCVCTHRPSLRLSRMAVSHRSLHPTSCKWQTVPKARATGFSSGLPRPAHLHCRASTESRRNSPSGTALGQSYWNTTTYKHNSTTDGDQFCNNATPGSTSSARACPPAWLQENG